MFWSSFLERYEKGGRNVLMLWAITPQGDSKHHPVKEAAKLPAFDSRGALGNSIT